MKEGYAIATLSSITKDNPTLCLSAKRVTRQCQNCEIFREKLRKHRGNLEETLKHMKCHPLLTDEAIKTIKELEKVMKEADRIRNRREGINRRLTEIHG